MAATRIEIEHSGYGWSAEIDAHGRSVPRLLAPTLEGLLALVLTKVADLETSASHKPREPDPVAAKPHMALLVSRRSLARARREQRETQQSTASPS